MNYIDVTTATSEEIGRLIRGIRLSQGISIRRFAGMAGVTAATVQNVENGAFTPRLDIVQRMMAALGKRLSIV